MSNQSPTEYLATQYIPNMVAADPSDAITAYGEFNAQLSSTLGDITVPGASNLNWDVLAEITDGNNHDQGERRRAVAEAARSTTIIADVCERGSYYDRITVHTGPGTFLTVDRAGAPLAFGHELNPEVPAEYGCIDGAAFRKLSQAVLIEKLMRQGADSGEGYERLKVINKELGIIGPTGEQTIGMAMLHEIPYTTETAGKDRNALVFSGTAGRTASRLLLVKLSDQPSFVARMGQAANQSDQLAGLLDTLSSTVANRAAIYGVNALTAIVELPDPRDRDYENVNWN